MAACVGADLKPAIVVKDKNGENYVTIDNPILLDEVFGEFLDLFDETFDDDEDDDGEGEADVEDE